MNGLSFMYLSIESDCVEFCESDCYVPSVSVIEVLSISTLSAVPLG